MILWFLQNEVEGIVGWSEKKAGLRIGIRTDSIRTQDKICCK